MEMTWKQKKTYNKYKMFCKNDLGIFCVIIYIMTNDDIENAEKCQTFECIKCNFKCCKQSNYVKHLLTRKHKMMTNDDTENAEKCQKPYSCICGKSYKHRQGLSVHKRKCEFKEDAQNTKDDKVDNKIYDKIYDKIDEQLQEKNTLLTDKELVKLVLKQNQEIMKQNQDINDKMVEFIKNGCNNTTNNNYNKTFNLNIFLNQECKDAMNIMDFVDSLKLQLTDLENVGKLGYVNGISNIIVKNLQALDITKRPVHCSDIKREVLYVKDEDQWEKDTEKNKLRKAIKHVAHKNSKMLNQFKEKYPDCLTSESKKSEQYMKLLVESMGGSGNNDTTNENKIIKNIAKEVTIDK